MSDARRVRVIETPPRYPPFIGGVENVSQAVCRRLAEQGDDVTVVCADEPKGAPDHDFGVKVRRLPWRFKIANTNITLGLPLALARSDWDVVSTHLPTPWSADWSVLIARLLGRASVVTLHNAIVGEGLASLIARLYRATVFRVTMRLADRIIVVSDFWKDHLISLDRTLADKIRVSPNGVDVDRFRPGHRGDGRQLLFVGILDEFHRYKGLDVLLHALADLGVPFELTVIGEGDLRSEYEKLSTRLGISDKVNFAGHVDEDSLLEAYRDSDVYVLPSRAVGQEAGFTLTALEAMASGLPVVLAEGVGQLAINAEEAGAGIRVPSDDSASLTMALRRLLLDAQEREHMGCEARRYVERFHSWDAITLQRLEVWREALQAALERRSIARATRSANPVQSIFATDLGHRRRRLSVLWQHRSVDLDR